MTLGDESEPPDRANPGRGRLLAAPSSAVARLAAAGVPARSVDVYRILFLTGMSVVGLPAVFAATGATLGIGVATAVLVWTVVLFTRQARFLAPS